jgi:predicted flap endonuclease-1-like 5' DNA nuclease
MSYLLTQMFLYMLVTFLLGLLLGWLLWRHGSISASDYEALKAERNGLAKERDDLKVNLDACRSRSASEREAVEKLRADKIDLQTRLDAMKNQRNARLAKPAAAVAAVAAAPVAAAAAPKPAAKSSKPKGLTAARGGKADDLKEINGVGPAMEKLLNKLGYFHFDQIAAWTKSEEAWVDDNLEGFKGRVSRDHWIRQAKKLAKR